MTPDYTGEPSSAGGHAMTPRTAFWCALCIWVLTLATAGTAFIYNHVHSLPASVRAAQGNAAAGVAAVMLIGGFATVGALLAWKRPANPIGWLMSATGATYALAATYVLLLQFAAARAWGNWGGWLFFSSVGFVVFVLLMFPTGSLPSRRWRPVAWAAGIAMVGWALGNSLAPVSVSSGSPVLGAWPGRPGASSPSSAGSAGRCSWWPAWLPSCRWRSVTGGPAVLSASS
jgi:hypothetical protein